MHAQFPDHRRR